MDANPLSFQKLQSTSEAQLGLEKKHSQMLESLNNVHSAKSNHVGGGLAGGVGGFGGGGGSGVTGLAGSGGGLTSTSTAQISSSTQQNNIFGQMVQSQQQPHATATSTAAGSHHHHSLIDDGIQNQVGFWHGFWFFCSRFEISVYQIKSII